MTSWGKPTVYPYGDFSAETDANCLRNAMKGFGTDEDMIIEITGNRNNAQRLEIREAFMQLHGRDLLSDLSSELSGNLKHLVVACYQSSLEFDAESLHWAIKGVGTNEKMLNTILLCRSSGQLSQLQEYYQMRYNNSVMEDIANDTSGSYMKVLLQLLEGSRDPSDEVNVEMAQEDANELFSAGVAQWGTDEDTFNKIFLPKSFAQLRQTFHEYAELIGQSIQEAIENEMSGELKCVYQTLIDYAFDPVAFFAHTLNDSMKGFGTNDHLLRYMIVSRSEIDLGDICDAYLDIYQTLLIEDIQGDTSGDYEKLLLLLVGHKH